jgi:nitrate reductase assembly molybdenum cofactor insertion protein NarJ
MMSIYNHLAKLFSYPDGTQKDVIDELLESLGTYSGTAEKFAPVATHFSTQPVSELQEYYIRTFDVNAACYLDIGYVLFGEESKRGQFLLYMRSEQKMANNDCGTEFADHLPNVLTLLPKMEDAVLREELVVTLVLPSLKHMLNNFRTETNIYRILLEILSQILQEDFSGSAFEPYQINQKEIECQGIYSCGMDLTKLSDKKFKT